MYNAYAEFETLTEKAMLELALTLPPGEQFLPSLTKFHWEDDDWTTTQLLFLLLTEGLREISLRLLGEDIAFLSEHLSLRCPNIVFLALRRQGDHPDDPVSQLAVAKTVDTFSSLRSVAVYSAVVTFDLLQKLSRKPHLRQIWLSELAVSISHDCDVIYHDIQIDVAFPQLLELSISTTTLLGVQSPEILLRGPRLQSLHIDITESDHMNEFDFLTLVSSSCGTKLKHFSLKVLERPFWEPSEAIPPFTMVMLEPLLSTRSIETFVIEHPAPPNLNDEDLQRFSYSFPELRHFELCVQGRGAIDYEVPTLRDLLPFARNCRKLISFGMYMDTSIEPPSLRPDDDGFKFTSSLETMYIFCSKIDTCQPVVEFLASVLSPNAKLELIRHSKWFRVVEELEAHQVFYGVDTDWGLKHDSITFRAKWKEVRDCLNAL